MSIEPCVLRAGAVKDGGGRVKKRLGRRRPTCCHLLCQFRSEHLLLAPVICLVVLVAYGGGGFLEWATVAVKRRAVDRVEPARVGEEAKCCLCCTRVAQEVSESRVFAFYLFE